MHDVKRIVLGEVKFWEATASPGAPGYVPALENTNTLLDLETALINNYDFTKLLILPQNCDFTMFFPLHLLS